MNLLVCDDSSFARKQILRALPATWDVHISQAGHGAEAMEHMKAGQIDVLILDLNMPVMDGFEVLAKIDSEYPVQVIVVSGDIQPESRQRVMQLGAKAFLRKPVEADELCNTLDELGLLAASTETQRQIDQSVDTWDSYKEIANVAVGRAADLLARYLGVFVKMPVPSVSRVEANDLTMILQETRDSQHMTAVCQGFIGSGISGEVMLIVHESDSDNISALMKYKGEMNASVHQELLLEVSSMFISAAMQGLGEQLDIIFSMGHPVILGESVKVDGIVERNSASWNDLVMVEMESGIENYNVSCNMLILLTRDSMQPLDELIEYLAY
jgi:CheY-like chemotaxis protein